MNSQQGSRLVQRTRREGAELRVNQDGGVLLGAPHHFPMDLLTYLKRYCEEVANAFKDGAEFEAAPRSDLPTLFSTFVDRATGRQGWFWGATRHGLIINFGPGSPLLTLDLREVSLVP
jgi:hypothetical protein